MRKMKSRILAAILAAGMIFTAQGMTALAGTIGVGAAKTGQSTGGPGETVKDVITCWLIIFVYICIWLKSGAYCYIYFSYLLTV